PVLGQFLGLRPDLLVEELQRVALNDDQLVECLTGLGGDVKNEEPVVLCVDGDGCCLVWGERRDNSDDTVRFAMERLWVGDHEIGNLPRFGQPKSCAHACRRYDLVDLGLIIAVEVAGQGPRLSSV